MSASRNLYVIKNELFFIQFNFDIRKKLNYRIYLKLRERHKKLPYISKIYFNANIFRIFFNLRKYPKKGCVCMHMIYLKNYNKTFIIVSKLILLLNHLFMFKTLNITKYRKEF